MLTQDVYLVEACDFRNNRAYRRIADGYKLPEPEQAWDDIDWITLDVDDDFMQKSLAIKAGENYDTRVSMELNLDHDTEYELMKMAHAKDITLNEMIGEVLQTVIDNEKKIVAE